MIKETGRRVKHATYGLVWENLCRCQTYNHMCTDEYDRGGWPDDKILGVKGKRSRRNEVKQV